MFFLILFITYQVFIISCFLKLTNVFLLFEVIVADLPLLLLHLSVCCFPPELQKKSSLWLNLDLFTFTTS